MLNGNARHGRSYFHSPRQCTVSISFEPSCVSGTLPGSRALTDKSACPQGAHSNNDAISPWRSPCHPAGQSLPSLCPSALHAKWHLPHCVLLAYLMSIFCLSHNLQEGQDSVFLNILAPGPQTVLSTQQLLIFK